MRKITRTALGQHGNREQRIESTSTTKGFRSDQLEDPLTPVICAAFGLVLAGVKLRDDVQDSGRWPSRLFWWMYRRRVTQAEELMEAKLPGLMQSVEECIRMHRQMETSSTRVPLDDFTWPTGKGFAEVFRRTAQLIARLDGTERYVQTFEQIGRLIGESIIAWDCAVDFDNDRIKGNFNPLCDESDRVRAFQLCHLRLAQIGWLCPADSVSGRVIRNVMNRVERRITNPSPVCTPSLLERWGLIRQRGYAYARCDGCEALCCFGEVLECCGSAAMFSGPNPCCAEAAWCCTGDPCSTSGNSQQPKKRQSPPSQITRRAPEPMDYSQFIDREGETSGSLTPVGFVMIDGQQIPARSHDRSYVNPGVPVRVVAADQYGVTVRPVSR